MNSQNTVAQQINRCVAAALILSLASVFVTRVLKAFTFAELLAIAAFLAGLSLWIVHRRAADARPLDWPRRLIVIASLIGFAGLAVKLMFVLLGIGTGDHDMQTHEPVAGPRVLQHIHHLFFNIGFLLMVIAAIGMLFRRIAGRRDTV